MGLLDQAECILCGHVGDDVSTAVLAYRADPVRYERGVRCQDHVECRRRVEYAGEAWPLIDELPTAPRFSR